MTHHPQPEEVGDDCPVVETKVVLLGNTGPFVGAMTLYAVSMYVAYTKAFIKQSHYLAAGLAIRRRCTEQGPVLATGLAYCTYHAAHTEHEREHFFGSHRKCMWRTQSALRYHSSAANAPVCTRFDDCFQPRMPAHPTQLKRQIFSCSVHARFSLCETRH